MQLELTAKNQQPMCWHKLLSPTRLYSRSKSELARSPFHKDYDRLVFSRSFRQLNRKTQVHPLTNAEGIHTRLTHSLEVSCIGRSLAMLATEKLQDAQPDLLPEWITPADIGVIVQAACLAHDIGNPPFGHAGEYAIQDWFYDHVDSTLINDIAPSHQGDLLSYEGNAQGFRVLTRNEYHPDNGGMRLTCATLAAFMKYPWLSTATTAKKYGCFHSESGLLHQVAEQVGLIAVSPQQYTRHPLAYLIEAADDICYALIDLEDGIQLNMLSYEEVEPIFVQIIGDRALPPEVINNAPLEQRLAALRGRAMNTLVDMVTTQFVKQQQALLHGSLTGGLLDYCPDYIHQGITTAKQLARDKVFSHSDKARLEIIAGRSLHTLLDAFVPLARPQSHYRFTQNRLLNLLHNNRVTLGDDLYHNILSILDMITMMTDHQAYQLAQELRGNLTHTV